MKRNLWLYVSVGGLILSYASLFLPVIKYTSLRGTHFSYNLVSFFAAPQVFLTQTLYEYTGNILSNSTRGQMIVLVVAVAIIGVTALVLSSIGIASLSLQKRNIGPFILALLGLMGTALPALVLLVMFALSGRYFQGTLTIGAYAFVTPLTMACAMFAVTYKHKANREELRAQEASRGYWHNPAEN